MIPGIYVNQTQSTIHWENVRRSGVRFAFIKATEYQKKRTNLLVDSECMANIAGAERNNIYWSACHIFRSHIDPIMQANDFVGTVNEFSSLPPAIFVEADHIHGERLNHKFEQFVQETKRLTQKEPIIFISNIFWKTYFLNEKKTYTDWAAGSSLGIMEYTNLWPEPVYPWASWDFWQYTNKGRILGIDADVCMCWFNGTHEEMARKSNYHCETENTGHQSMRVQKELPTQLYEGSQYRGDYQESLTEARYQNKSLITNGLLEKRLPEKNN